MRRGFQGVGTSAALATSLASVPLVHAQGQSEIRVGLVGCGGRGSGAAINAMQADQAVRVTALADLYEDSMQRCRLSLQPKFKEQMVVTDEQCFAGFDGYKSLLDSDIDVVLLASPPHYRPDHIEAAVEAGKQIFCEKPVATDPTGVRRVEAACRRADEKRLNVVSGLCWRYDRGLVATMDRVHEGAIGRVIASQANYLTNPIWMKTRRPGESDMEYQCRNWYNHTWLSGDHIVEQFVHSLDKALWLHGDEPPIRAYGQGGRQRRSDITQGDIYDHFHVVYEWADGTKTFASTRQMRNCMNEVEDYVMGEKGVARLIKHRIDGESEWRHEGKDVQMHQAEQNEFFKAIRGHRPRINNGLYMCRSTMMAILGREVCYSGRDLTYEAVSMSPQDLRPPS
ncbi:MAG: Gfo/Idh/MocA family oxidoreductase, partial [Planctomycetota bacterium]